MTLEAERSGLGDDYDDGQGQTKNRPAQIQSIPCRGRSFAARVWYILNRVRMGRAEGRG